MKKYLAILLSVVLLLTSVLSVSMLTASAEGEATEPLADNAVMPEFSDIYGNKINVLHTNEYIPSSVSSSQNMGVTKNTSALPFSTLFEFTAGAKDHTYLRFDGVEGGKGAMFYVEMPESADGGDVRFSTQFYITDGQSGEKNAVRNQYGYQNWYYLAEGDSIWNSNTINYYGISLPSGFRGYVYIPFKTITGGASDLPDTPENEKRPHELNDKGQPLYLKPDPNDPTKTVKTTEPADADGNPYPPSYTYQPSNTNPYYKNAGFDDEDMLTGFMIQTASNYMAANGNMSPDDKVVVSAPVIIKGEVADTTTPDTAKLVADSESLYLFEEYKPYNGDKSHTVTFTPSNKVDVSNSKGTLTEVSNQQPFSKVKTYKIDNVVATEETLYAKCPTLSSVASIGVMFYIDTTVVDPEIGINPQVLVASVNDEEKTGEVGTYKNCATSHGYGEFYYLREGDTSWKGSGEARSNGSTFYFRKIVGNGFKGYVYHPFGGNISQQIYVSSGYLNYAGLKFANANMVDKDGNPATFIAGTPMAVTSFDKNSTYITLDDGSLVDASKGSYVDESTNYGEVDKFVGKSDLVNNGKEEMLEMFFKDTANSKATSVQIGKIGSGTSFTDIISTLNYKLVDSTTVQKHPFLQVTGKEAPVAAGTGNRMFIMPTGTVYLKDIQGVMLYIDNSDANADLVFNWQILGYYYQDEATPNKSAYATQTSGTFKFLSDGGTWQNITMTSSKMTIPAGTSGYLYIDKGAMSTWSGKTSDETARLSDIRIFPQCEITKDHKFSFAAPMWVTNWTEKNVGMALVNGSKIAQNIWTGEFTAPNDYNGDLAVNILDLVRGKVKEADIADFRASYLGTYFTIKN